MAYIANSEQDREEMLREIGVNSFEDLIDYIPAEARFREQLKLPDALSEYEAVREMNRMAQKNRPGVLFIGGGAYDHYVPAAVRHILWRSEFYTAYTPYQAEVSQGTLQAIYEYQSMICRLTGMEVANASMYDGGSALAEAVLMAVHHTRRRKVLVAENINPAYREIISTYAGDQDIDLVKIPVNNGVIDADAALDLIDEEKAALILQTPNYYGLLEDAESLADKIHSAGGLLISFVDPISLAILESPAEYGADIAVSEGQAFGNNLNYGGPYLGVFATKKALIRKMPGRIVGATTDTRGRRAYVTVLQTREQHIRRAKATSNICTNSQLCALAATVYLSLLGKKGLVRVARACLAKSHYLAEQIAAIPGFQLKYPGPFFREFAVETPVPPAEIIKKLAEKGIYAGIDLHKLKMGRGLLIAVTEKRTRQELDEFIGLLTQFKLN